MKRSAILGIVAVAIWVASAAGEEPVYFPDQDLREAVESAMGMIDPTPTDMLGLTSLTSRWHSGAMNLSGLEYALNLLELDLTQNGIWHIDRLSGLVYLRSLNLNNNKISDLSPLSGMGRLEYLNLHQNRLSDISPLAGLSGLKEVYLYDNQISDISPLSGLKALRELVLTGNPLNQEAYRVVIPRIKANNPGVNLLADPPNSVCVSISSTAGGLVIDPGEGVFTYSSGTYAKLEARADPCFVFLRWSGSYEGVENPMYITMDHDYEIRAHFVSTLDVLVVDDDGPADSGLHDPNTGDPQEDGTDRHPFHSVQEAIEMASEGATVLVHPGIYHENVDFLGKGIRLIGMPDPKKMTCPVIAGIGGGPVVTIPLSGRLDCQLSGLTVMQGRSTGGIYCAGGNPTISNCLIVGNRSTNARGAAVTCVDCNAILVNCTIADNVEGPEGGGMMLQDSNVTVSNSIIWGNHPRSISPYGTSRVLIRYSDVAGGWQGTGILSQEPLFVQSGYWVHAEEGGMRVGPDDPNGVWLMGDYHLRSQGGRWEASSQAWILDTTTSPCIDGGDPDSSVGQEPAPNGGIVNMGVYGDTPQASKSPLASGNESVYSTDVTLWGAGDAL
jgi:hypothetical protein